MRILIVESAKAALIAYAQILLILAREEMIIAVMVMFLIQAIALDSKINGMTQDFYVIRVIGMFVMKIVQVGTNGVHGQIFQD